MSVDHQGVYKWKPDKYIQLVEYTQNPYLKKHQELELEYILGIKSSGTKTFIDIGAGYGRTLSALSRVSDRIIAIEINKDLLRELRKRASQFPNVEVIAGNANKLSKLLNKEGIRKPVLLLLQNSLGTWEGDYRQLLEEMKKVAERGHGEIVISLFNQEVLRVKGMEMYQSISELVGEPDFEATDFTKGIFSSKSGYISKWWITHEREEIRNILGGQNVGGIETNDISIIHVQFPPGGVI